MNLKLGLFILLNLIVSDVNANVVSMSGKIPPGDGYREISVELAIMHIYDINLDHQTVRLSGYFRQSWNDSRMIGNQWDSIGKDGRKFFLMNKADAIWYPDTFISNSLDHQDRQSFSGDPQGAYHYFRVYTDGEVFYSQMIELKVKTKMNLKYFPFNVLNIELDVESYGYPDHTLRYATGINPKNKAINRSLELEIGTVPGYIMDDKLTRNFLTVAPYSPGNFSKIKMAFDLIPNDSSLFILSIPNLLLIIISSFVFWMDVKKKLSERLSLGITAMLADFALSFSLPVPDTPDFMYVREYINISYIFIGFSIFFTFMEYIIVSFFYNIKSEIFEDDSNNNPSTPTIKCKSLISKSVQNLKEGFTKLLNMNDLLRNSLMEYMNNSIPEEPVMPIKAALGIFYLLCWVSFMVAHIIPGKIIIEKAQEGIEYQVEAVSEFYIVMIIGMSISLFLSIIGFYIQYKSRNKWYKKMQRRDKYIDKYTSSVDTNIIKGHNISLEESTLKELTKKKRYEFNNSDIAELDNKLDSLNEKINNDFNELANSIDNAIDFDIDNDNIEDKSEKSDNIIVTTVNIEGVTEQV